jgi:hypothetical protein
MAGMTDTPMASILIVEDDAKQLKLYAKACAAIA